jgi:hypothetical protein
MLTLLFYLFATLSTTSLEPLCTSTPPLLHYCVYYWPQHSFRSAEDCRVNDAVFDILKDTKKIELLNTFQHEYYRGRSGLHLVASEWPPLSCQEAL